MISVSANIRVTGVSQVIGIKLSSGEIYSFNKLFIFNLLNFNKTDKGLFGCRVFKLIVKFPDFHPPSIRDLRHIYINDNQLVHIRRGMFPQNVATIDLTGNPIEKIDVDAFDECEKLSELRLPLTKENIILDGLFKSPIKRLVLQSFSGQLIIY